MAKLVEIIGVGHSPSLPRRFLKPEGHPGVPKVKEKFAEMRQRLGEAQPQLLVVIAHDHVNQWFLDNMPAFLVGKAPIAEGPFAWEEVGMLVPHYRAPVDVAAARTIIEGGFRRCVDFSFSEEFTIDHAFTGPLAYVRPEQDLPIIPIFTNVMCPPIPTALRFYQVGEALRAIIEEDLPSDLRVAALVSGHLSVELGGPKVMDGHGAVDPEFDRQAIEIISRGDVDVMVREWTYERMISAGNFTSGVLDYVMAIGLARGKPPTQAEGVYCDINTHAFLAWDLYKGAS